MTYSDSARQRRRARTRNSFATAEGHAVIWQLTCWDALKVGATHATVRPLSSEDLAVWAKGVLQKQYPERSYEVNKYVLSGTVSEEQLTVFQSWATDEVGKLELAQKFSGWT